MIYLTDIKLSIRFREFVFFLVRMDLKLSKKLVCKICKSTVREIFGSLINSIIKFVTVHIVSIHF